MKTKKIILIAFVAMMLVGVQGYAQPRPRYYHHRPYYYPRTYVYYTPRYVYYPSYGYYYNGDYDMYAYGSTSRPTKVRIKDIEFKRMSDGRLRIKNGKDKYVYLNTYKPNKVGYGDKDCHIVIETDGGNTTITVMNNKRQVIAFYTL